MFVAWADDVMVFGPPLLVEQVQHDLDKAFTSKHKGNSQNTSAASLISHKAMTVWDTSNLLNPC